MGSGLIYVGILAMWAAYLVPVLMRRHDAVNEVRSVDRFSRAMRILSRRPATPDRRYVVMPQRPKGATGPVLDGADLPARRTVRGAVAAALAKTPHQHPSSQAAPAERTRSTGRERLLARRRRLGLVLLSLTTLGLLLATAGVVGWWAPVLPGLALAAFVVHLRAQARQHAALRRRRAAQAVRSRTPRDVSATGRRPASRQVAPAEIVTTAVETAAPVPHLPAQAAEPEEVWAREEAENAWRAAAERATREAEQAARAQGWEPVPVVVPTYVTKPKARPSRVIDLTKPGRWTEGRGEVVATPAADQQPARSGLAPVPPELLAGREEPFDARAQEDEDYAPRRRAVGD